jgi:hypothetical protein
MDLPTYQGQQTLYYIAVLAILLSSSTLTPVLEELLQPATNEQKIIIAINLIHKFQILFVFI